MSFYMKGYGLSGNTLKIIAAVTMLIDHIGVILFPRITILRIIGRISFPIYAFMLAEGCAYTKNKLRYFLMVFVLGAVCQAALYINGTTKLGVLISFSLSIIVIYALQYLKNAAVTFKSNSIKCIFALILFLFTVAGVYFINKHFTIDYGFWGCMTPLFASILRKPSLSSTPLLEKLDNNLLHLILFAVGLIITAYYYGGIQTYCILALPLLLVYSGKRGKFKMKYFFYIFYPVHIVILEGISYLL